MARSISEVMTRDVVTLPPSATLVEAALTMRGADIGDVIITAGEQPRGIVTDRDIVIRGLAEGRDPAATTVGDISSGEMMCLTPDHSTDDAARLMRQLAVRRLPIVDENDKLVGVVSLGDLAVEEDRRSPLADISAAPPNE